MSSPSERLSTAFDVLPACIAMIDATGMITAVNAAWKKVTADEGGVPELCGVGANYLAVCDAAHGEDREDGRHVGQGIRAVLNKQLPEYSHDYPWETAKGRAWFRMTVRPITDGAVIMHVDITSLLQARELATEAVGNDPLTDLASRSRFDMEFEERVGQALEGSNNVCMMIIKIEGLSGINARLGYQVGDRYLREMASRLRAKTRSDDLIARIGGDEFAIARVFSYDREIIGSFADRIARVLCKPLLIDGELMHPVVSAGVSCAPDDVSDAAGLMDFADQACRIAQSRGGGVHFIQLRPGWSAA